MTHDIARESQIGALFMGLICVPMACLELVKLARAHAPYVQCLPIAVVTIALIVVAHWQTPLPLPWGQHGGNPAHLAPGSIPVVMLILSLGLVWTVMAQMFRHATEHFLTSVSATLMGMIYFGGSMHLLQHLALIESAESLYRGSQLALLFIATTKIGDVCAYFGGRRFGKNKMSPRISPGKTWEGFAFSFIGGIGGAYLLTWVMASWCTHAPFNGWWQPLVWAVIIGPLGVLGDLAESAMKRDATVKDSGESVPGFGGILDVLDAIILGAPVAYILALLLP
jgi:CDP-diglyceride synthetase